LSPASTISSATASGWPSGVAHEVSVDVVPGLAVEAAGVA
jgi:hypothetical protein